MLQPISVLYIAGQPDGSGVKAARQPPLPCPLQLLCSYRKKLHAVIMFLINAFGGYVQLQFQSNMKSPFDDHATIMAAIMVNLCLYALSVIAEYALPNDKPYFPIIKTFGPLLGFLVIVLLLIILVPLLGTIASTIWAFFIVRALITWSSRMVQYLHQGKENVFG